MLRKQVQNHILDDKVPKRISTPIDPEKYAESGTEDAQQIALFLWAWQVREDYPELKWMYAIPNGGFRTRSEAARLRAMGVKSGVPDICLPIKRGEFSGLYIELKRDKSGIKKRGEASPEQKEWLRELKAQGFGSCICYGFRQARDVVLQYLEYGK